MSEAACVSVLLAAQEAPSVLFRPSFGGIVGADCQVLVSSRVVFDDGCLLPQSNKVLGLMRNDCTQK